MRNLSFLLLTGLQFIYSFSFAQKLKRADKTIVSNLENHLNYLNSPKVGGTKAGSRGEEMASLYVLQQLEKQGIKPWVENKSWYQKFNIYDGRDVTPATFFSINGNSLKLYHEYFPFCFSANKKAEASVSPALSENGVPWFADLKELLEDHTDSAYINPVQLIRTKAATAAAKGATALIIYNRSDSGQLRFTAKDNGPVLTIPVLYVTKPAVSKYLSDESANLDLRMNVALEEKHRISNNIIGFQDNGSDSTIMISTRFDEPGDVAALLELARLLKKSSKGSANYLFVVFSGEEKGSNGISYFNQHPVENFNQICHLISLESAGQTEKGSSGLQKVKETISIIDSINTSHKISGHRKA